LTFSELRRAVQALSAAYVERRGVGLAGALDSAGKRAAFALYYGALHFLAVRALVAARPRLLTPPPRRIVDFGCGTGVAGAAWALAGEPRPEVLGIDKNAWALREARWTLATLALRGRAQKRGGRALETVAEGDAVIAAWAVNELAAGERDALATDLAAVAGRGARVLLVEPVAGWVTPWWGHWRDRVFQGRATDEVDELDLELPDLLRRLDDAAGMHHAHLKVRTLCVNG
jgi:hypothetical protein